MAEIHVQAKKQHSGSAWIWIIIGLIIAAIIIYFVTTRNNKANDNNTVSPNNTTSYVEWTQQFSTGTFIMNKAC